MEGRWCSPGWSPCSEGGKRQHCPHGLPKCCIPLWICVSSRKKQTEGLELGHIKPYEHTGDEAQQHHSRLMEINGNGAATALAHNLFIYLVMPATINRQWFPYCSLPSVAVACFSPGARGGLGSECQGVRESPPADRAGNDLSLHCLTSQGHQSTGTSLLVSTLVCAVPAPPCVLLIPGPWGRLLQLPSSWAGMLAQLKAAVSALWSTGLHLTHGLSWSLWPHTVCRVFMALCPEFTSADSESCAEIFAIHSQSRGDIFADACD